MIKHDGPSISASKLINACTLCPLENNTHCTFYNTFSIISREESQNIITAQYENSLPRNSPNGLMPAT